VGIGERVGVPHLTPTLSAPKDGEAVPPPSIRSAVVEPNARQRPRTRIARRMRRDSTEVEKRLWRALPELAGAHRFRRQHPIGRYIVDFACPSRKLAIEIDGGQHAAHAEADAVRTREIAQNGYRVIRFWNSEVAENFSGVLERIQQELDAEHPHLTPALSAPRGREGVETP
jgi:very-short-patch-repair endonuclease